jgi:hypothetical protein
MRFFLTLTVATLGVVALTLALIFTYARQEESDHGGSSLAIASAQPGLQGPAEPLPTSQETPPEDVDEVMGDDAAPTEADVTATAEEDNIAGTEEAESDDELLAGLLREDYYSYNPSPERGYWPDPASVTSFDDLSREINAFVEGSIGRVGLALYMPGDGIVLSLNEDDVFPLASVVKLYVMLTYLDAVRAEERELTETEVQLLTWMITVSDNEAAEALWYALGPGRVSGFLASRGLEPLPAVEDGPWGDTVDSPRELATVLGLLLDGDLLGPDDRDLALDLMRRVTPSQRWGAAAGLEDLGPDTLAAVHIKNGWYPGEEGWRINSAAIIQPFDGQSPYVLVVLTTQPSYDYGIETIDSIARLINGFIVPPPPLPPEDEPLVQIEPLQTPIEPQSGLAAEPDGAADN